MERAAETGVGERREHETSAAGRPGVSVVVPFHGGERQAAEMLAALARLRLRPDDELIVADNTDEQVVAKQAGSGARVVDARPVRSSYYARNVGAGSARNPWLLFTDADCRPAPDLLDAFFTEQIPADCGAVAGEVLGLAEQDSLIARYSRSRGHLGQAEIREHPYLPMAVTANLLVRRECWRAVGGFHEGIRSSGDIDFSWRLQQQGWTLGYAAGATVQHVNRESLRAMIRQSARYGAGRTWLRRRHPEAEFPSAARGLLRCAAGVAVWLATGRFERALFKALDAVWLLAEVAGSMLDNVSPAARRSAGDPGGRVLIVDSFPEAAGPTPEDLRSLAGDLPFRIESVERPRHPQLGAARGLDVTYLEDDGRSRRLRDLGWLAARHPLRCLRALRARPGAGGRPIRLLAPAGRRMARCGDVAIAAAGGDGAARDADRLAAMTGVARV